MGSAAPSGLHSGARDSRWSFVCPRRIGMEPRRRFTPSQSYYVGRRPVALKRSAFSTGAITVRSLPLPGVAPPCPCSGPLPVAGFWRSPGAPHPGPGGSRVRRCSLARGTFVRGLRCLSPVGRNGEFVVRRPADRAHRAKQRDCQFADRFAVRPHRARPSKIHACIPYNGRSRRTQRVNRRLPSDARGSCRSRTPGSRSGQLRWR